MKKKPHGDELFTRISHYANELDFINFFMNMDGADHCLITNEIAEVEPDIKICK
jgi:hypothetical protein